MVRSFPLAPIRRARDRREMGCITPPHGDHARVRRRGGFRILWTIVVATVALAAAAVCAGTSAPGGGAPRDGDRFVNPAGTRGSAGPQVWVPFLARKVWTSTVGRDGGAPVVRWNPAALAENPSVTWIGHAAFLVRMDGVTFLTDPMFSTRASPVGFAGPKRLAPPGVPLDALPRIDFATLSHDHYDHTDLDSIRALAARGTRFVAGLGMGDLVREAGGEVIELDWWQSAVLGPVEVHCVPAQHFSGRSLGGGDRRLWAGWVIAGPTRRFYHAGDTGYFPGFREIGARLGPIDLAALPIGAYEPPEIMHFVHLNPEEAVRAARDVGARRVVGMHWGTFDLTDEPLDEPPRRMRAAATAAGYDDDAAFTMAVGETRRW
jgi:N-acyl-phosphatidylethanolamine-hydrolysing phospholipase D